MPTFRAPNNVKLRCESHRRYWVVEFWTGMRDGLEHAEVIKRTDNQITARQERTRTHLGMGRRDVYDSARRTYLDWRTP